MPREGAGRSHVYVRFTDESVAAAAKEKLDGMTFDGRKVSAYFFPIADFVNASWRVRLPPFPPPAALYAALALALALAPRLALDAEDSGARVQPNSGHPCRPRPAF